MPPKPRQVRIESKSALAAMQQLESRSDEELEKETRFKAAAQAILGARAAERPRERWRRRRMAEASRALAERRADDLRGASEKLGVPPISNRQLWTLRIMGVVMPPPSAGVPRRILGIVLLVLAIVALLVLGFGIVKLVALPFGGIG